MSFTHQKETLPTKPHKYFEYGECLPAKADYWMRSDGIFIFRLELDDDLKLLIKARSEMANKVACADPDLSDEERALSFESLKSKEIVKIAKLVSDQIKSKHHVRSVAHGILLPQNNRTNFLAPISITPRKISSPCLDDLENPKQAVESMVKNENIRDHLSSKIKLVSMRGKGLGRTLDIKAPVALLLRQQFNHCFEACFHVVDGTKHQPPRLPFFDAPRINSWLGRFSWINVRSFWCIFALYVLSIILIMAIIFWRHLDGDATISAFWSASWTNAEPVLAICTFMFSILFGFVEVLVKRNQAIKAFEKAQEILRAGNIYCLVTKNLFSTIEKNPDKALENNQTDPLVLKGQIDHELMMRVETEGDFTNAIDVLQIWKAREQQKQWFVIALLTPLVFYSGVPVIEFIQDGSPLIYDFFKFVLKSFGLENLLTSSD
ncbi:hypothetical protein [Pseudosulfitobacter sp. SM2401]|uniref:hypothetical protein n=1 Tax=Pseudosulfitobacter sp. SM2401 TaxID=3350098 RepID=UPI0036F35435